MNPSSLKIGWAEIDITPDEFPVLLCGQFHARLCTEIRDRLNATVCVLEEGGEVIAFVSCDLVTIPDELRDQVRARVATALPQFPVEKIILHATHTHTAPVLAGFSPLGADMEEVGVGVDLGSVPPSRYNAQLEASLSQAIIRAWEQRQPGSIAYGIDTAVIGRNRRWVDRSGQGYMYRLNPETAEIFSHIEGCEDHSLNLLATYNAKGDLLGVVVNLAAPSQERESAHTLSADYWHETRLELRRRFGPDLFILPQCSPAGELTGHPITEKRANARMLELRGRDSCQEIALRISDALERILPVIEPTRTSTPGLKHQVARLELPLYALSPEDVTEAEANAEEARIAYESLIARLENEPDLPQSDLNWRAQATAAYQRNIWHQGVVRRSKVRGGFPVELHAMALGEVAFATNPFEYYLDYGMQIKLRSPAIQTFLVQLAGGGTYLPSPRADAGGAYGATPPSTPVGPEGGQLLADQTVALLRQLFS